LGLTKNKAKVRFGHPRIDPFNEAAVKRILAMKQRSADKGLILVASNWDQIKDLVGEFEQEKLFNAFDTWPGPYTWVFPASEKAPTLITGKFKTIALRITDHPTVCAICDALASPIVSTSANIAGQTAAMNAADIENIFGNKVDFIVPGELGGLDKPTEIRDVLTGQVIRAN